MTLESVADLAVEVERVYSGEERVLRTLVQVLILAVFTIVFVSGG